MNHAIAIAGALIGFGLALGGGAMGAAVGDGRPGPVAAAMQAALRRAAAS